MKRVFTQMTGAKVEDNGDLVSVRLTDANGTDERLFLSPDLLEDLAHQLLGLKAGADHKQQAGVPPDKTSGSQTVSRAIPIAELRVDTSGEKVALHFWGMNQAHYCFSLQREFVPLLRTRLEPIQPR